MLKTFLQDNSGNIALTSAVVALTLLAAVGAAIDISNAMSFRTTLQDSTDIATLAAVQFDSENEENAIANTKNLFSLNEDNSALENINYNVRFENDRIIGNTTADYPLFFANVLPQAKIPLQVETVVATDVMKSGLCIKALNQAADPALRINSGAQVIGNDCKIDVHSTQTPAFVVNSGVRLDVAQTCIAGRNIENRLGPSRAIQTSCPVDPDPFYGKYPVPNSNKCDYNSTVFEQSNVNLSPGVYCGTFNFSPEVNTVNFDPGTYILRDGDWVVDGAKWKGNEVTFYFSDTSKFQFNSGIEAKMTPPRSGPFKDVFMTEAPNLPPSDFIINDALGFDFEGIVYLPSRQLILNSGATVRSRRINLVADTIIINNAVLNLMPFEDAIDDRQRQAYIAK